MSTIQSVRRCFSCGAKLQSENPEEIGYINPETLATYGPESILLCDHCFRDSRYNIAPKTPEVSEDYLSMVKEAKANDSLVIYVVDLFSFESSFPPVLVKLLEGVRLMIIANKRDLMPKKIPDEEIKEYVAHRFRASKLSVTKDDVFLACLRSTSDVTEIADEMEKRRQGHNVLLVGAAQAGKTAFRDAYLKQYRNRSAKPVMTNFYGDTKIAVMQIPLDDDTYLCDSPGIALSNDMRGVCPSLASKITPNSPLEARKYNVSEKGAVSIEGLALILLSEGKRSQVTVYARDSLHIHFHHSKPATKSFFKRIFEQRVKVSDPNFATSSNFDAFDIKVEEQGQRDIGIEGLGWVSFKGNGQTFTVLVPKGVSVYTSRAKIKDHHAK